MCILGYLEGGGSQTLCTSHDLRSRGACLQSQQAGATLPSSLSTAQHAHWQIDLILVNDHTSLTPMRAHVCNNKVYRPAGVDGLSQRLSNMRQFVQQQINTLTAKQVRTSRILLLSLASMLIRCCVACPLSVWHHPCLVLGQLRLGRSAKLAGGVQDDTLAAQAALEKQLAAVGDDVEDINTRVGEVRLPLQAALHTPVVHIQFVCSYTAVDSVPGLYAWRCSGHVLP